MKYRLRICFSRLLLLALAASALPAQTVPPPNYEEGKVPQYTLPDPLVLNDGQRVTDAATWREKRRPEVLRLFEQYVYGKAPGKPDGVSVRGPLGRSQRPGRHGHPQRSHDSLLARRQRAEDRPAHLSPQESPRSRPRFPRLELRRQPHDPPRPGHHAFRRAEARQPATGQTEAEAVAKARGASSNRWPIEKIIARGYGVATAWYGDIEPDMPDGLRYGVRQTLFEGRTNRTRR